MTIFGILRSYGFQAGDSRSARWGKTSNDTTKVWYGSGSLVWGTVAEIALVGDDLYEVKYHKWQYDCNGECIFDESTTAVLHGALVLEFVFTRMGYLCRRYVG